MLPAVALVLVLAQSPTVTPPSSQPPISFAAAPEPLRLEAATIAWQGPNYRLAWVDRRRFFDEPTSPPDVWTAEWNDTASVLTNLTVQLGGVPVSDVKLAVGRTDARLYVLQSDAGLVTRSLAGSTVPGPVLVATPNLLAVAALEDEFLVATRNAAGVSLLRPTGPEQISAAGVTDLRVTTVDGGFLVSFLDPAPKVTFVQAGQPMANRAANSVPLSVPPSLFAPIPIAPPSFVVIDAQGLRLQVPDAGAFQALPLLVPVATPTLVTSLQSGSLTLAVNSNGAVSVPSGGGVARATLLANGFPVAMASHDLTASVVVRQSTSTAIRRINVSTDAGPAVSQPVDLTQLAPQRSPSVVWSSEAGGFVVAWEERTVGGFAVWLTVVDLAGNQLMGQQLMDSPLPSGHAPRLLAQPDGGLLLKLRQPVPDGGFVGVFSSVNVGLLTTSLTILPPVPDTSLVETGPRGIVQWTPANPTQIAWPLGFGSLLIPAPRCVASAGGAWWFSGLSGNVLTIASMPPSAPNLTLPVAAGDASACAAVSADGSKVMVAVRGDGTIELRRLTAGGQFINGGSSPGVVGGAPIVTALGDGFLVAIPVGANISAWQVNDPSAPWVPIQFGPGGGEVNELVAASSPRGDALVAWRAFEPNGRHSVRLRVLKVPQPDGGIDGGGSTPDAGGPADAGAPDAGALDAGELDAGELDAGLVDAGETARDAGLVDAGFAADAGAVDAGPSDAGVGTDGGTGDGGVAPVSVFVPVCGCASTNGLTLGLLALAFALTRRRGREAARTVFR